MARRNQKKDRVVAVGVVLIVLSWGASAAAQDGGDGTDGSSGRAPHLRCAPDVSEPEFGGYKTAGKARIQIKKSEVKGSLDKAIVYRVVRRHGKELLDCYKQSLQDRPGIEGEVGLKFLIGPVGEVKAALIASDTVGDPTLRTCLTTAAKTWQFPKPRGSMVEVVAPLRFYLEPVPEPKEASSSGFGGGSTSGFGAGGGDLSVNGSTETMTTPTGGEAAYCNPGVPGDDEGGLGDVTGNKKIPKITRKPVMVGPGGSLSKEIIRRVIRTHKDEVDACYTNRFIRRSKGGKLKVEFAIDGKGKVTRADVIENDLNDGRVEICLVEAIQGWRFPEPKGGGTVIVKYPFDFKPVTDEQLAREDAARSPQGLKIRSDYEKAFDKKLREHHASIQECYSKKLWEIPSTAATIRGYVEISGEGKVRSVMIRESFAGKKEDRCARDKLGAITFPKPPGKKRETVTFEMSFIELVD